MLDFLYQSGWGAFAMLIMLEVPFVTIFLYVVFRKTFVDQTPATTSKSKLARLEGVWIVSVIVIFIAINVASIKYMPTVIASQVDESTVQVVDVTASSWAYDITDREYEVGQTVRFNMKSADTMHGFAVYHPDGRMLFTAMLVPGLNNPSSIVHTFSEPGAYKVRCLEYCGIAHHAMRDVLTVVEKNI